MWEGKIGIGYVLGLFSVVFSHSHCGDTPGDHPIFYIVFISIYIHVCVFFLFYIYKIDACIHKEGIRSYQYLTTPSSWFIVDEWELCNFLSLRLNSTRELQFYPCFPCTFLGTCHVVVTSFQTIHKCFCWTNRHHTEQICHYSHTFSFF